jgi:hypothetical protein
MLPRLPWELPDDFRLFWLVPSWLVSTGASFSTDGVARKDGKDGFLLTWSPHSPSIFEIFSALFGESS